MGLGIHPLIFSACVIYLLYIIFHTHERRVVQNNIVLFIWVAFHSKHFDYYAFSKAFVIFNGVWKFSEN